MKTFHFDPSRPFCYITLPFGYRPEPVLEDRNGRLEVAYTRLIPDPETSQIVKEKFRNAACG